MFAILQITDQNTNIFRKPKIESERVNLPNREAFFIVRVQKHRRKIPWKKLEMCLGILKYGILLPVNIKIPDDVDITPFSPCTLPRLLLMNSAVDHILKNKQSPVGKSLTIFDEEGIYAGYTERLINKFSSVKIVTPYPENYEEVSDTLLEKYGFSLLISDETKCDTDAVITNSCTVPLYYSGTVYTNRKKYLMNAEVFTGNSIELPSEYENLRPENIDRILFASALYEKCGVKEMAELKYSDFTC